MARCPQHGSRLGAQGGGGLGLRALVHRAGVEELGDAEVEHLGELAFVRVVREEDVVRLEVAVDDPPPVRLDERAADLTDEPLDRRERHRALVDRARERAPLDVLHRDVRDALVDAVVEDLHDVHAAQLGRRLRLAMEAREHPFAPSQVRVDELDGDGRPERGVLGAPDRAHPPSSERGDQAVAIG
jgi:hypothetical protein